MSIISNLKHIKTSIPANVQLVCVSKFHTAEMVLQAYNEGERAFGESRVQEFLKKRELLPQDIRWHFIGHLQTNKVKSIVPFVYLIQSVDSEKLLAEINKEAAKIGKKVNCLLEVHIAQEASKQGFLPNELIEFLTKEQWVKMKNIQICGLMAMATFTENTVQIATEMQTLKMLFEHTKNKFFANRDYFVELSIGMTNDYTIAIAQGATIIRIGSAIFGQRT